MDLNLRKINSPGTTASSRREGLHVFEIKVMYMRTKMDFPVYSKCDFGILATLEK
jgi:hypothetical protein